MRRKPSCRLGESVSVSDADSLYFTTSGWRTVT